MIIDRFTEENSFLSNFHRIPVVVRGTTYKTAEHAYQALKAATKRDHDWVTLLRLD